MEPNFNEMENWSDDDLYLVMRSTSVHTSNWPRLQAEVKRRENVKAALHRAEENLRLDNIERRLLDIHDHARRPLPPPRPESRTWAFWIGVVAIVLGAVALARDFFDWRWPLQSSAPESQTAHPSLPKHSAPMSLQTSDSTASPAPKEAVPHEPAPRSEVRVPIKSESYEVPNINN